MNESSPSMPDETAPAALSGADRHICPVCGFDGLLEEAYHPAGGGSFEICPSCGYEFGFHDDEVTHDEHRAAWIARGAPWRVPEERPESWDLRAQLANIDVVLDEESAGDD